MLETWKGETIATGAAKRAITEALSQLSQSGAGEANIASLADYIAGLPDGQERFRELARWGITDGVLALGEEATRYVRNFDPGSSRNSYDLLLSQVISAQKRQNGRGAAAIQHEGA